MNILFRGLRAISAAVATASLVLAGNASADAATLATMDNSVTAETTAAAVEKVTGTADVRTDLTANRDSTGRILSGPKVDIPSRASGTLLLPAKGSSLGLKLPVLTDKPATISRSGTVVYADEDKPADIAVQPLTNGDVRTLVSIKNISAAHEYRFGTTLPKGARLVPVAEFAPELNTGEILVQDGTGDFIGAFDIPWARDANGRPVQTNYRIEGNTIVQTVEFDEETAFPVIADPWWKTAGKVAMCAGTIGGFIAGNALLVTKAAKFGGVFRGAKLIVQAGNREERIKLIIAMFGEVTGIGAVIKSCA
jgi:hypothetical protein